MATDTTPADRPARRRRVLWAGLSMPAIAWLAVFFVVPFYAVLAVAGGQIDELQGKLLPEWNPFEWSRASFEAVIQDFTGPGSFLAPLVERTVAYVILASLLALVIGYPAAYYVSRFAKRRKGLLLALLLAPFWVSYMMRMLAWIGLLQTDGYVNRVLIRLHLISTPVAWLGGKASTVILGLTYGYVPYLILVLYAGLDRIDGSLIEAGRDLGLNRVRTFMRITLPLSRQTIITALLITMLPMAGDYFTNQMLSGATNTSMLGNAIQGQLQSTALQTQGAALSLMMLGVLAIPMIYYVVVTNRASQEAA
ncbi:MAG TPA: ABC transporter permease [Mycobacteriales bacterium]|nr:ABC transporter permease [Mycobacteriales bacterium]